MCHKVGHQVVWAAECELGKVSRQEVRVAKLASQRVVFGELRHRDDRHGAAEQATPFLHVVKPARARAIGVELNAAMFRDQFDVTTLVDGGQVRKDGGQCADRPTGAATVLRGSEGRDGRGVDSAA